MTFHNLPEHVLVNIATYLKQSDVKNCLNASTKTFGCMTVFSTKHTTNITPYTKERVHNLNTIIDYIQKIKPRISEHKIYFHDIDDISYNVTSDVPQVNKYDHVSLYFIDCSDVFISYVIKLITSSLTTLTPKIYVVMSTIHGQEEFLKYENIAYLETRLTSDTINIVLNHPVICQIPELVFVVHTNYTRINLSNIDCDKNKRLVMILAENEAGWCNAPHKITQIIDCNDKCNYNFYNSIRLNGVEGSINENGNNIREEFAVKSRLKDIYLHSKIGTDSYFVKNTLPVIPDTVEIGIKIHDNTTVALVDTIMTRRPTLRKISYICNNEETHLNAMFVNEAFPKYKRDIVRVSNYSHDTIYHQGLDIHGIYEKMNIDAKQWWFTTYSLLTT